MKTQLGKDMEGINRTADRLTELLNRKQSFVKTWFSLNDKRYNGEQHLSNEFIQERSNVK